MNDLNKQAAESIVQMIKPDPLVEPDPPIIFIGSGLSIPPYKSWTGLLDQLSTIMGVKVQNTQDPTCAAQELYKSNPEEYLHALKSIFVVPPTCCRPALRDIATIDFKAFLTTNFDRTIELAFHWANRTFLPPLVYPNLQVSLCCDQNIHFVHGQISEDSKVSDIVFHQETYYNAYYSENKLLARYFFDVLFANDVLFTGFGLSKFEPLNHVFEAVIRTKAIRHITSIPNRSWKILLPKGNLDSDFEERLNKLKIEVILYDKMNDDYEGLDEVWSHVSMKVKSEMLSKQVEKFDPLQLMEEPDWASL